MNRYLHIYKAIIKQTVLNFYQYRFATYSWLVGKILEPLVFLIIWKTIAETSNGDINGLKTNYFIIYYLVLMVVGQFTFTFLIWDFGPQIISGDFSNKLILPMHPIHYDLAENIGYKIFSMPVILTAAILLYINFKVTLVTSAVKVIIFLPILILSFILRFLSEWTVALSAFWFVQSKAITEFYYVALLFFSGRVAPLEVFPAFVKNIAQYLPFRFMISYPIEIILNKNIDLFFVVKNTFIQILWICIALIVLSKVYKSGIKKYTAVGI